MRTIPLLSTPIILTILLLVAGVGVGGCGSAPLNYDVSVERNPNASFSRYRTYAFSPNAGAGVTFDPSRLPAAQRTIGEAIERELTSRGLKRVEYGQSDLVVDFQLATGLQPSQDDSMPASERMKRRWMLLTVSLYDWPSMQRQWQGTVRGTTDDPDALFNQREDVIGAVFRKF